MKFQALLNESSRFLKARWFGVRETRIQGYAIGRRRGEGLQDWEKGVPSRIFWFHAAPADNVHSWKEVWVLILRWESSQELTKH